MAASPYSDRVLNTGESLTVATFARIGEMRRQGVELISLVAGEPDFDTPENIKNAAIKAIQDGHTKYTSPAAGLLELREAIAEKLLIDNRLAYDPSQIVVTCGAKQVIFDAIVSLINPGDEAIIPAPYWVSYADQVRLMGGEPVILPTTAESGFRISPEQLQGAIGPRTKFVLFNSPCNPTGEVYTSEELEALSKVIAAAGIFVISDEIYEKIIYDGVTHTSIASFDEEVKEKTMVVNGFSKAYAMTGWRVGYGAGPPDLMKLVAKVQSQETTNTCTISQHAALEALKGPQDSVEEMRLAFRARRNLILERLNRMPGVSCRNPQGAFYVFPDISELLSGDIVSDFDLFELFLSECKVGCVPGSGFGNGNHLRFSYATSEQQIETAMDRIEKVAARL
jgi:aspartate aminotransferase